MTGLGNRQHTCMDKTTTSITQNSMDVPSIEPMADALPNSKVRR